jgi:benzylsuccinate CoA-transferase BbsF subunit
MRAGNQDPRVWHQGVYPALGHDRWIAISLFERADHARLVKLTGLALPDPERALFHELLSAYTREREDFALMHALQGAGIAAGVVQDAADLLRDPGLRARPAWQRLEHPVLGAFEHQTTPFHLSRTRPDLRPAPRLGQHTHWVCRSLLGLSEEQHAALLHAGLFR